jgi:hypothetical protein
MFWYCTGVDVTMAVIAPISGLLGIGGSVLFGKVWPAILSALERRAKKEIRRMVPDDDSQ